MKTYQDLQKAADKKAFVFDAISEYKGSEMYKLASDGDAYARQRNTTIMNYQKLLYTMSGRAVPDNFTANHKCASNFFSRFITQENQYLLGNGVTFNNDETKQNLGGYKFDTQLQKAGKAALAQGVAYGFWNYDHIDVFKATELVPLWDEEDGLLKAAIRFWRIAYDKPIRATLYELDGYTDYIQRNGAEPQIWVEKRDYRQTVKYSEIDGAEIYNAGNYPSFPIIPLWANPEHQSELVGLKSEIDAYDLIKSGFANDLDDASMIYWTLENCGGMDDIDLAKFIEHMKTVKAAIVDGGDGAKAEAHTLEVPYQSRETYLTRLENDMYNDAMALNVNQISAGNVTATAIKAAYEPLNNKTDQFEYCVREFISAILYLIGVDDVPSFKRSRIANVTEETNMILSAKDYLDRETIINHLPFLSADEVDALLAKEATPPTTPTTTSATTITEDVTDDE